MSGHAGLTKVTKNVKGKKGMVRRSYWVRGKDAVKAGAKKLGGFVSKHKGKIAAAAAIAGGAYLGVKHGHKISGAYHGAKKGLGVVNAIASRFHDKATRKEKAIGIIGGAMSGISKGAKADNARMESIRSAPSRARAALKGLGSDAVQAVREHRDAKSKGFASSLRGAFNGVRASRRGRG